VYQFGLPHPPRRSRSALLSHLTLSFDNKTKTGLHRPNLLRLLGVSDVSGLVSSYWEAGDRTGGRDDDDYF